MKLELFFRSIVPNIHHAYLPPLLVRSQIKAKYFHSLHIYRLLLSLCLCHRRRSCCRRCRYPCEQFSSLHTQKFVDVCAANFAVESVADENIKARSI